MRVGLIDVDGHAKKKKFGATIYPNLALCKISAWHKKQGDDVVWYEPMYTGHCDKVYNNILAAGDYAKEQLRKIIDRGYRVDFNQAMDARLVTPEFAELLAQVKWIDCRIRFGCDTPGQVKDCEKAMNLINSYGYKGQYFLYTMLNDNFSECYERINHWWKKNQQLISEHHKSRVYPYAQPYRDPFNPSRPIPQWQKDMAGWVNKKMLFEKISFEEFQPRKGFKCKEYLKENDHGKFKTN